MEYNYLLEQSFFFFFFFFKPPGKHCTLAIISRNDCRAAMKRLKYLRSATGQDIR